MRSDDPAYGIGIREPHVKCKGDQVLLPNDWLKMEVYGDKEPCCKVRQQAVQRFDGIFILFPLVLHHAPDTLQHIEDKDKTTVDHVPFGEGEFVDVVGNEGVVAQAESAEHGLLPEGAAAFYSGEGVDDAEG